MTNKPMLSVERELLELVTDNKHIDKESISIRRWEALCKLRAILSKPAARQQGEPVAWQYRVSAGPATGWSLWHDGKGEEFKNSYQVETRPLYAEQPAPVALYPRCTILKECNTRASSSATALKSQGDPKAVEIPEHTMRSVMDAIQKARGFPALTSNQCHALAESLNYVARLNGMKP